MGAAEQIQEAITTGITSLQIEDNNVETLPNEIGLLTKLTSLEINCHNLRSIPIEIGQLTNLSSLVIHCYNLATLPKEISRLVNLKTINISGKFIVLPLEIYQLINLTTFVFSAPITILHKRIGLLTNLTRLGIGSLLLSNLPDEICELKNLVSLEFGCSGLTSPSRDFKKLSKLPLLSTLKLHYFNRDFFSKKELTLPSEIGQLSSLQSLEIECDSSLLSLPIEIGQLKNLTYLKIYGSRSALKCLPLDLFQLADLHTLEIDIDLEDLPETIGLLVKLKTLHLNCISLEYIPFGLCNLTNLEEFSVTSNKIITFPLEICRLLENVKNINLKLPELEFIPSIKFYDKKTSLTLNFPKLNEIPADIGELTCLESLELNCENLNSLTAEIGHLFNLKSLKIRQGSKLTSLPSAIGQLTSLTSLEIGGNDEYGYPRSISLTSLPPEIGKLKNLETLKIRCPDMTDLPDELRQLSNLKKVEIEYGGKATTHSPFDFYKLNKLEKFSINHKKRQTLRFLISGRNVA